MKRPEDQPLPDGAKIMQEDESLLTAELEDADFDDSEVLIKAVIASLNMNKLPKGIASHKGGSLMSVHAAESLDHLVQHSLAGEPETTMPEKLSPGGHQETSKFA